MLKINHILVVQSHHSKIKKMSRSIAITAVDGHTGFLIAELLLTDDTFKKKIRTVAGLSLNPHSESAQELSSLGAKIVPHKPGDLKTMVSSLQELKADVMCLIPPAHKKKYDITVELIEATKQAGIPNVCFLSSAGCDLAERDKQPSLRQFIDLETLFMASKGDASTSTGHSPVVIRYYSPGFPLSKSNARLTVEPGPGSMQRIC